MSFDLQLNNKPLLSCVLLAIVICVMSCLLSCANTKVMGGVGKTTQSTGYAYTVQNLKLPCSVSGIIFKIVISKSLAESPVEPPLNFICDAVQKELKNSSAKIFNGQVDPNCDVTVDIILSRHVTQKYYGEYTTFVDAEYAMENMITKRKEGGQISISGNAQTAASANSVAMGKFMTKLLVNKALVATAGELKNEISNKTTQILDKMSVNLLEELGKKYSQDRKINIALVDFKGAAGQDYSNIFTTSLLKYWPGEKYNFYTRNQLDALLKEHALQMAGILDDSNNIQSLTKLNIADLIITGNVMSADTAEKIIEIQVIDTFTAQIIASKRSSL